MLRPWKRPAFAGLRSGNDYAMGSERRNDRALVLAFDELLDVGTLQGRDELLHRVKSEFGDQIGLSTEAYGAGCKLVLRKRKR